MIVKKIIFRGSKNVEALYFRRISPRDNNYRDLEHYKCGQAKRPGWCVCVFVRENVYESVIWVLVCMEVCVCVKVLNSLNVSVCVCVC